MKKHLQVLVIAVLLKIIMRRHFSIIQVSLSIKYLSFDQNWIVPFVKENSYCEHLRLLVYKYLSETC